MTLTTTQVRPGHEVEINPLGKFVLAHNGTQWNGSFLAAVQFVLTNEVQDGPVTIDVLVETFNERTTKLETLNVSGTLTAITADTLTFTDGMTVPTREILAVWY